MKPKILLIDDDSSIRILYGGQFEHHGFDVKVVHDGKEALSQVGNYRPEVILLDMMMPMMDGMEFLKELRNHPDANSTPVIILTNLEPTNDVLEGILRYKPAYYMLKDKTSPEEMVQKVNEMLQP